MRRVDLVFSLILLLLGAGYLFEASKLPLWKVTTLGGGLFPLILGIAMVVVSALSLAKFVAGRRDSLPPSEGFWPPKSGLANQARLLGALVLYTLMLELVGFLLATFVFLTLLLVALEPEKKLSGVAMAGLLVASSYLLLVVLLKMQLPRGWLG